jgi:hypothetical protein
MEVVPDVDAGQSFSQAREIHVTIRVPMTPPRQSWRLTHVDVRVQGKPGGCRPPVAGTAA